MKHGENPTSPHVLSLKMSRPIHPLMNLFMMNKFLLQFMLLLPSLIRMLPPSIKKQILKRHISMCLLKVIHIIVMMMMENK